MKKIYNLSSLPCSRRIKTVRDRSIGNSIIFNVSYRMSRSALWFASYTRFAYSNSARNSARKKSISGFEFSEYQINLEKYV